MSKPQIIGTSHSIVQRDGQTYIAVDGMTPDQIITWMHDHQRAQAFAAIRRAAAAARHHDRVCLDALARNKELICERHEENAEAIREAIRAAIGSDKS